jgi:GAF domain-containing protein
VPDVAGPAASAPNLGEVMGQVARALQREHGDVEATLAAITRAAVGNVPGADECAVTLVTGRRRGTSRAATAELARAVDEVQERLGEGPCLSAVYEQATVRLDDLQHEHRWPRFAAAVAGLGMRSMLSFQLFVTGGNLGALNLYSRQAYAFGEESETIGLVFASHAAIALAGAQQEERMRTAMGTRELIGQAQGILMERFRITADAAFQVLVRASSHTNRKVADIAEELVSTGVLAGSADR